MTRTASLRSRLTLIILIPLLAIALGIGFWAYRNTELRAHDRFDRSLLSTALAISRDIALSGGDALSRETRDLIRDTSGGPVFYHVFAPDGVFVTGYATPPVPGAGAVNDDETQTYFEARYRGETVRVLRLRDAMQIDGLAGDFTFTVWQDTAVRDAFVRDLSRQTFTVIATLIASVGLIVWFGVGIGLRPLLDLQNAISQRSSNDLAPIQRPVPDEVKGIVGTLNTLLSQVSHAMQTKNDFISNAAHQLRNPIAGVLSMAEAVKSAPDPRTAQDRSHDLVDAAKKARNLANQLLTLERANAMIDPSAFETFNLSKNLRQIAQSFSESMANSNAALTLTLPPDDLMIRGDAIMIREAVTNLVNNALMHGGAGLSTIELTLSAGRRMARIDVSDDGAGIEDSEIETALERFGQVKSSEGSGLGLPIAQTVARQHGGALSLASAEEGLRVTMTLPLSGA